MGLGSRRSWASVRRYCLIWRRAVKFARSRIACGETTFLWVVLWAFSIVVFFRGRGFCDGEADIRFLIIPHVINVLVEVWREASLVHITSRYQSSVESMSCSLSINNSEKKNHLPFHEDMSRTDPHLLSIHLLHNPVNSLPHVITAYHHPPPSSQ